MAVLQMFVLLALAPLVSGLITKIKNWLRLRRGAPVLQPYYNLAKYVAKDEVVSEHASWIFRAAPVIVFASALTAACLVPVFAPLGGSGFIGDFWAVIFLFALGRVFLALAALDTGSAFGGLGSSREMFLSALVEPVVGLVIFALAIHCGSTDLAVIAQGHPFSVTVGVAAVALLMVILTETSRVPVDNQETHLELTMIHEAMVLEYAGRSLALLEMGFFVRQMVWFLLLGQIVWPSPAPVAGDVLSWGAWAGVGLARLAVGAVLVALIEVSVAKMRLFRAVDFLMFGLVLSMLAVVCSIIGV